MRENDYEKIIYNLIEEKKRLVCAVEKKNSQIAGLLEYVKKLKNELWQNAAYDVDELNEMERLLDYSDYGSILP